MHGRILVGIAAALIGIGSFLVPTAQAQLLEVPKTYVGDLWSRPRLTGNWFGILDELAQRGVWLDVDLVQVLQGVGSGGRDTGMEYGGHVDYRLRRAMIGFGSGSAEIRVQVEVYDLATDPHAPFLVYGASEASRKIPGAIIFMDPYLMAARYMLAKGAPEKEVKQLGTQIATDLAKIAEEATSGHPSE